MRFRLLNILLEYRKSIRKINIKNYSQEEYWDIVDNIYIDLLKDLKREAQEKYDATMAGMANLEESKLLSIINRLDGMITAFYTIEYKKQGEE